MTRYELSQPDRRAAPPSGLVSSLQKAAVEPGTGAPHSTLQASLGSPLETFLINIFADSQLMSTYIRWYAIYLQILREELQCQVLIH